MNGILSKSKCWYAIVAALTISWTAGAFDLSTASRSPLFQKHPTLKTNDWTTEVVARLAWARTYDSFDAHENQTSLFNGHGYFDVVRLGLGLSDVDNSSRPTTKQYWGTGGTFANPTGLSDTDGKFECGGLFRAHEAHLLVQQNLMWGFYLHLFVPFKENKIDRIVSVNRGPESVRGQNMAAFMKDKLPLILHENGLKPLVTPLNKSEVGDASLAVGWHGHHEQTGMIRSIDGFVQIGCIVPLASEVDQNIIFAIPFGYNEHFAINCRSSVEVSAWDIIKVGLQAGSIIFFTNTRKVRLKTDPSQNGWITLEKKFKVRDDYGTMWDFGGFFEIDYFVKGLSLILGYSYTKQERTLYNVKSSEYLREKIVSEFAPNLVFIASNAPNVVLSSRDDVANSEKRLKAWDKQALHFVARYDMSYAIKGGWGPLVEIEYSYPIYGKFGFAASTSAGSLGFSVALNF